MSTAATRWGKRWLFIGHRWLGIATCLLCAMWFMSGVVMMYVPYPRLTERERIALLPPLHLGALAVTPDAALRAAGIEGHAQQFRLTMFRGEPVYRISSGTTRRAVSGRNWRVLTDTTATGALAVVQDVRPGATSATVETFDRDQWTVAQGFDPHRPLHKVTLNDDAGTELYVSSRTGEIVQDTTRRERVWNWLGAVPHWLYPTVLRQDGDLWRQVVLWTSGPATIGAIAGLWVGILRLRMRRPYSGVRVTPYRGWMKWHHLSGLVAGLFLTTWLWSGWLSVNPFRWFDRAQTAPAQLAAYAGLPSFGDDVRILQGMPSAGVRDLRFTGVGGRALAVATGEASRRVLDARTGEDVALAQADIVDAARKLVPGASVTDATLLTAEDAYWYSHHNERPIPILRVTFGDDDATWVHIDPATGEVLGRSNRSARLYRWLFNALHDFDLAILLRHRPAWDIVVWLLSLGGLVVSVSGVVIGWRRLGRKLAG